MIYLDNAATTIKKPDAVYDAVLDAMKHCGNSGRGASDASLDASRKIYEARMCLTEFFGGDDAARLVFTANATEALNIAIHGLFEPGEHVITTQLEHNSVLRPLYMQRERGVGVDIVPCSDVGIKRGDNFPVGHRGFNPSGYKSHRLHTCFKSHRQRGGY